MKELIHNFLRSVDSTDRNKTQLVADIFRVLGPAAASYLAGYGAEIAATAACGPGLGPLLVGGIVRTHVSGMYQIDMHRPFVNWLREKCGLNEEEARVLFSTNDDTVTTQPTASDNSVAKPSFKEKAGTCAEKVFTRGLPTIMTGFALGSVPAVLGAPASVANYLGKSLQACAPSFFGCLTEQRDHREAKAKLASASTTPSLRN